MLEKLVHGSGRLPPNQHYVKVTRPRGLSYEIFSPASLRGWDRWPATVSRSFGERWCLEKRTVVLIVPSVVARLDSNILVNPAHEEFSSLEPELHEPVFWDRRLFGT